MKTYAYLSYLVELFSEWEMFQTKIVAKVKTHIWCSKTSFWNLDILLTVHLSIIYFSLFPTWYTVFSSTYNICYPLSSTCFRPHRPIIRRSKLYMQPMVFSPSADVFVVRPLRKNFLNSRMTDVYRGGEYYRLHVQFRPPDDGPVRSETCRGKRIADIVRRRKNSVSSWK